MSSGAAPGERQGLTGNRRGSYLSLFYAGIWLAFLSEPIQTAWAEHGSTRGALGVAATVAFAAAYLVNFLNAHRAWNWGDPVRPRPLKVWVGYAALVALAALATVTVGQDGSTTWVFLAVSGMWIWSRRVAWVIALGMLALDGVLAGWLDSWTFDLSLGFAILLAMAAVTGGVAAASRQRALSTARQENARLAVQEERNRMARDLHDILGHSLTVITVKAELAGRLMDEAPERARSEVADLERLSRDALADVRRAVEGYREISLAGELARAREALAAAGIHATLPNATDEVPSDLREAFAWVVREGVTNVIRHSGAEHCTITLDGARLTIRDDGRGRGDAAGLGNGLRGVQERAGAAGAMLISRDVEPHGFELTVTTAEPQAHTEPTALRAGEASGGAAAAVAEDAEDAGPESGRSSTLPVIGRKARTS